MHETRAERKKAKSHTTSDDLSWSLPLTPTASVASFVSHSLNPSSDMNGIRGDAHGGDGGGEGSYASSECSTAGDRAGETGGVGVPLAGRRELSHMRNCSDATMISNTSEEEEQAASSQNILDMGEEEELEELEDDADPTPARVPSDNDGRAGDGVVDGEAEAEVGAVVEELCNGVREVEIASW